MWRFGTLMLRAVKYVVISITNVLRVLLALDRCGDVVVALAGGPWYSLAVKADGTVWAWGFNGFGQLGDGTLTDRTMPVQVMGPEGVGTLGGAATVAAGYYHSLALMTDGTIWAWGGNYFGQLGDFTTFNRTTPVQVRAPGEVGALYGVRRVAAGDSHSLALMADGTVWAWGRNYSGQLGDGTNSDSPTPVQVKGPGGVGVLGAVVAVAAGAAHNLALKTDGTTWAWGGNSWGQLGDGTITDRATPVQVKGPGGVGVLGAVVAVAAGLSHSLTLKTDGTVWAWGYRQEGELGDGTSSVDGQTTPVKVKGPGGVGVLAAVVALAAGGGATLALKNDGTVWAWGWNSNGQLGDGTLTDKTTPVQIQELGGATALAAGGRKSLAVMGPLGTLWTWGDNQYGQLGDGTTTDRYTPAQVDGFGSSVPCPPV